MLPTRTRARRAGVLYLLLAVMAPFNLMYIPTRFFVSGDAAATAANIMAGEVVYRAGIFTGLLSTVVFLLVGLALYDLLKEVDRKLARVMVALVGVSVAVGAVNLVNQIAPLVLLGGGDYLAPFTAAQLEALALGFLRIHGGGTHLDMIFWGLWLIPFGVLVFRSTFIPKPFGVLLVLGGLAYVAVSFTGIVFPDYRTAVNRVAMPFYAIGEGAIILWLVIRGAAERAPATRR